MNFMIMALDKPNALELRQATRQAHLDYVRGSGVMEMGAPLLDDDGNMIGSLILIDVEDKKAAEEFSANDPYMQAGLFESVTIKAYKKP